MGDSGVGTDDPYGSGPPPGAQQLLVRGFDAGSLTTLRHELADCAGAHGMAGDPLDDFVLAVNELVTNAVRHGGGSGILQMWRVGGRLECEVIDDGAGFAGDAPDRPRRPSPRVAGGWGLWLARQLSDGMVVRTGPDGTRVRISAATRAGE